MCTAMKLRHCRCECMGGWGRIIQHLEDSLSPDCQVQQVKEKFGSLRVYIYTPNEEDFELVNQAEEQSVHTCEICGEEGTLFRDKGWYVTRCPKCTR